MPLSHLSHLSETGPQAPQVGDDQDAPLAIVALGVLGPRDTMLPQGPFGHRLIGTPNDLWNARDIS